MASEFASFSHHHRVIYSECTVGNHVYHARYLDILEAARGELIRHLGFSLSILQEQGFIFPILEIQLRHQAPARYDDVLTTRLWIRRLFGVRIEFAYEMSTPARGRVLEGGTIHVCTSLADKPRRVPKPLLQALRPYVEADASENSVGESLPATGS